MTIVGLTTPRAVLVRLEDEDAAEHADLRRGQTDALRVVHQLGHPVDEPAQVVVEVGDLVGGQPQRGIAVLADLCERKATPRLGLGFGLQLLVGLLVVVLVIVVVIVVVGHRRAQCSQLPAGNRSRIHAASSGSRR